MKICSTIHCVAKYSVLLYVGETVLKYSKESLNYACVGCLNINFDLSAYLQYWNYALLISLFFVNIFAHQEALKENSKSFDILSSHAFKVYIYTSLEFMFYHVLFELLSTKLILLKCSQLNLTLWGFLLHPLVNECNFIPASSRNLILGQSSNFLFLSL